MDLRTGKTTSKEMIAMKQINKEKRGQKVVVTRKTEVQPTFEKEAVVITCHRCGMTVLTHTTKEPKGQAYVLCFFLCLFGCCFLFWIPCMIESMYKTIHRCSNCKMVVGRFPAKDDQS